MAISDKIVGIVNTKNLFYIFSLRGVVLLEDALYPALFLKPDERVANALRLFQKARRPMALVRDEDGNILGLITLEDVLEEIVGEIEDEHDYPVLKVVRLPRKKESATVIRRCTAKNEPEASATEKTVADASGSFCCQAR